MNQIPVVGIGGVGAGICSDNFKEIAGEFEKFLTSKNPDFLLSVVKKNPIQKNFNKSHRLFGEGGWDGVEIEKKENKYVPVVYMIKGKNKIKVETGTIDPSNNFCEFYEHSPELTRVFFSIFMRICFYFFIVKTNGLFLHSSAIINNGKAYIFAGKSGSGKTTIAKLSSPRKVLSDEFVCIRKERNNFKAYSTPWGSEGGALSAKARKIFFLEHGDKNTINRLTLSASVREIFSNLCCSAKEGASVLLDTTVNLVQSVPCYKMYFSLEEDLWDSIDKLEKSNS